MTTTWIRVTYESRNEGLYHFVARVQGELQDVIFARGADEFMKSLCEKLGIRVGETTEDGFVTLEAVTCLAACDKAPMFQTQGPDGMTLYDSIGVGYSETRRADPRIVRGLCEALDLPDSATILDVGAGTGKYSRALADRGFTVLAIEPSEVMRAQSIPHRRVRSRSVPCPL